MDKELEKRVEERARSIYEDIQKITWGTQLESTKDKWRKLAKQTLIWELEEKVKLMELLWEDLDWGDFHKRLDQLQSELKLLKGES